MKERINLLLKSLGHAFKVDTIKLLTGGRQHRSYLLINKNQQKLIFKQLTKSCWLGDYELEHFEHTEALAEIVSQELGNSISAFRFNHNVVICHENSHYLLIPWVEGEIKLRLNKKQCFMLGADLARMHNLNIQDDYYNPISHKLDVARSKDYVVNGFIEEYNESISNHGLDQILSHRDINLHNIIWQDEKCYYLIDWESAGLINPVIELVGVALNCANIEQMNLLWENFEACIRGYKSRAEKLAFNQNHYPQLYYSWLKWMEYAQTHDGGLNTSHELMVCHHALNLLAVNKLRILNLLASKS